MILFKCFLSNAMLHQGITFKNHQSEMHKVGIVAGFKGVNCIKLSLCRFYMLCWFVTHAAPHSAATTDSLRSFSAAAELLTNCNSTVATAVVATWVTPVPWFIQTMQKIGLFTVSSVSHYYWYCKWRNYQWLKHLGNKVYNSIPSTCVASPFGERSHQTYT